MPTYRKLDKKELIDLANTLRYEDCIDCDAIRALVKDFYPSTAHKIICFFGNEYNDETYNLRLESLEVFDENNKQLIRDNEDNPDIEDKWFDAKYSIGDISSNISENESPFSYTVYMSKKNQPKTPELYIQDNP